MRIARLALLTCSIAMAVSVLPFAIGSDVVEAAPTELRDGTARPLGAVTVLGDSVMLGGMVYSPTIVDALTLPPMVFRDGEFVACEPLSEFEDYWFTPPLGLLPMHLSLHSEVATLPLSFRDKGLRECFFKINYWGMAPETVEKVKVLADFGFAGREPVQVGEVSVVPRDLLVSLMGGYVSPITSFLEPPANQPPNWSKEIVTEVRGTRQGKAVTYRLGTLTVKGSLPTGVVPSFVAQWLAEGRIDPGVYPPELALEPEAFFKELEKRGIVTQATVTEFV